MQPPSSRAVKKPIEPGQQGRSVPGSARQDDDRKIAACVRQPTLGPVLTYFLLGIKRRLFRFSARRGSGIGHARSDHRLTVLQALFASRPEGCPRYPHPFSFAPDTGIDPTSREQVFDRVPLLVNKIAFFQKKPIASPERLDEQARSWRGEALSLVPQSHPLGKSAPNGLVGWRPCLLLSQKSHSLQGDHCALHLGRASPPCQIHLFAAERRARAIRFFKLREVEKSPCLLGLVAEAPDGRGRAGGPGLDLLAFG
jgi:hypothetical protein